MMKCPTRIVPSLLVLLATVAGLSVPSSADARIGERREAIERRLFATGGIVYRDDVIEAARQRGMPYMKYMDYLPGSAEVRIYFKTDDGRRPISSELDAKRVSAGWDLHVLFVNGVSLAEVYKRSQGMSEFEFNQLLAIHADGSFWRRATPEDLEEMESAFGMNMVRDDGLIRAKKLGGDTLMVVDSEFDAKLAELNENDLLERAPVSVKGF